MSSPLRRTAAICLAAAACAAAGCGGDKPAYCQDKDAFKKSIDQLKDIKVSSSTVDDVKSGITDVRNSANTLVASAKQDFGPEAEALKTAVGSLGTAVRTAASSPSGQSIATVAASVSIVEAKFKDLSNAVSSKC